MNTKIHESLLSTSRFEVIHDVVEKNGKNKDYYYLRKRDSVCIIISDGNGKVAVSRVNRHNCGSNSFELIGGSIEQNESPIEAARREAYEETNTLCLELTLIQKYYALPSVVSEVVYLFLAEIDPTNCQLKVNDNDEDILSVELIELEKLVTMILNGEFCNATDALAVFIYREFLSRR